MKASSVRRRTQFVAFILPLAALVGCSTQPSLKGERVSVSGKVSHAGKATSGLLVIFQPLGDGHVGEFPLGKDGSFRGELIKGEYAYYVGKPTAGVAAVRAPAGVAQKYFEADLSRTVLVDAGKPLLIALD